MCGLQANMGFRGAIPGGENGRRVRFTTKPYGLRGRPYEGADATERSMPFYFFNVVDSSGEVMRDLEGISLPDLAAVREEAEESARQIVAEAMRMG